MKRVIYALTIAASLTGFSAYAQQPNIGCVDKNVRLQAEEIKQHYTSQGFSVYRDAMLTMTSDEEFPVVMTMAQGQMYQIIFVGVPAEWKMKLEVFDGGNNKLDEQFVMRSKEQPNYILYTFVPERTDNYMLAFLQKLKHEQMCGSITVLKLDAKASGKAIIPYTPK